MDAGTDQAHHSEALKYWLALWRAPGVGSATFRRLLARYPDPVALFSGAANEPGLPRLRPETLAYLRRPDWLGVATDIDWLEHPEHHLLTLDAPGYPALLRQIPDPPPLLFVHGDPDALSGPQLAMVGSRNPSNSGSETAHAFARHLAGLGLSIVSGLAQGIDAASHEGALAGGGKTVAVLGHGLDRIYPARHQALARRVVAAGALVSEFPLGAGPRPEHFPRRNRIISGLSLGVLVVEAAVHSGSLITARLAADQGREVFAVPGSIHSPVARGCHRLIREGAKLVETAADVLEELLPLFGVGLRPEAQAEPSGEGAGSSPNQDPLGERILGALGYDAVSVDRLVERSGLTAEVVSSMLLVLELQGHVVSVPGGLYARVTRT